MKSWTAGRLLGQILCEGRQGVGRSPERVEDVTGVSGRTVRRLEEGATSRPRAVTLESLASFYGLDPGFLRQLAAWKDTTGDELDVRLRDLAVERFGEAAEVITDDVEDPLLWLGMRLARAGRRATPSAWGMGRLHPPVATDSGTDLTELEELLADLGRLDRRRMVLVRELVRELRVAQDRDRVDTPAAT
jgi:transcriptional regulator with XRE-family HTH domain